MDTSRVISIFDSVLGRHSKFSNGEYEWPCPFCGNSSNLAINIEKQVWHCWICGNKSRNLTSLLRKIGASKADLRELYEAIGESVPYRDIVAVETSELRLPSEYIPLWELLKGYAHEHALRYLMEREIYEDVIRKYRLGFCSEGTYRNRIIIPSYDDTGKLTYFVARSFYDTDKWKYLNPPASKNVAMFDNLTAWRHPVVLCEGVFDAMAIRMNAVPLLGKTLSRTLRSRLQQTPVIYLALDQDAIKESLKIANEFINEGKKVFFVSLDGKDPSEIGFEKMHTLIMTAEQMNLSSVVQQRLATI